MTKVKTYVAPSEIDNLGLFAGEDIQCGTLIWEFTKGFDKIITMDEFEKLHPVEKEYLWHTGSIHNGDLMVYFDNTVYTNHSYSPNTSNDETGLKGYAIRDIKNGEELTQDYRQLIEIVPDNFK